MKSLYCFLCLLSCTINLSASLEYTPLLPGIYRPGYWWPVAFSVPPASNSGLQTSLDQFAVEFPAVPAHQPIAYFPVYSNFPKLSANLGKQYHIRETIPLVALREEEYLIGVYGATEKIHPFQQQAHTVPLPWLPDRWEGLAACNAVILFAAPQSPLQYNAIVRWVQAGGFLILADFSLKTSFRELIANEYAWDDHWSAFDYGIGGGISVKHPINSVETLPWQTILTKMRLRIPGYFRAYNAVKFAPRSWEASTTLPLLLGSVLHALILFWLWRYWRRNRSAIAFAAASLAQTIFVILVMTAFFESFAPVQYDAISLAQIPSGKEVIQEEQYHYFSALKRQNWHHVFSALPYPAHQHSVRLVCRDSRWHAYAALDKGQQLLWQTLNAKEIIGTIVLSTQKEGVMIHNLAEMDLHDGAFIATGEVAMVGEIAIGEKKIVDMTSLIPIFLEAAFAKTWKNPQKLTSWLFRRFSPNTLLAFATFDCPHHDRVGTHTCRRIIWTTMDSNRYKK